MKRSERFNDDEWISFLSSLKEDLSQVKKAMLAVMNAARIVASPESMEEKIKINHCSLALLRAVRRVFLWSLPSFPAGGWRPRLPLGSEKGELLQPFA
jgi:hypothetical protein